MSKTPCVADFLREKKGRVWRFEDWGMRRLAYNEEMGDDIELEYDDGEEYDDLGYQAAFKVYRFSIS